MRIAINGFLAGRGAGGLARHTLVLLDALLRSDATHTYLVLSDRPLPSRFQEDSRVQVRTFRVPVFTVWEQVVVPLILQVSSPDLYFGPAFGLPLASAVPCVVAVQDLAFRRLPWTFRRKARAYYQLFVGASVRKARRVITSSWYAARETQELLKVPADRIDVVHIAIDEQFRPVTDSSTLTEVRGRYALPARFILYVGDMGPRKNLERLIESYALARQRHGIEPPLVLAGSAGWRSDRILDTARRLGVEQDVVWLGPVDDADLPSLYSAAKLFVYPSLYEGFGLPPLEAMACGVPVITSNCSSLPEVVGDAALQVDPLDVPGLAKALAVGLSDEALRARLTSAGAKQALRFTAGAMAAGTLASFERAMTLPAARAT